MPWGHGREAAGGPAGAGAAAGRRLGLYGFGAAAHICLQIARFWGAEVYAFTREEKHRQLARELGAVWAGAADEAPGGDPSVKLDAAIIFAPVGELVIDALKVLDKGGTVADGRHLLVACAGHRVPADLPRARDPQRHQLRRATTPPSCSRLAAAIPITTEIQVFPLEQANDALIALKHDGIRGAAVLQVAQG